MRLLPGLLVVSLLAGCGGGGVGPTTPTPRPAPAPVVGGTQLYQGQAFSIAYPAGWWVYTAEQPTAHGTRTTILDPHDHARSIRIDVTAKAMRVPTGRPVRRGTFEGHDALRWAFRDHGRRGGGLFFADDAGRGVAIVIQAPERDYRTWAARLAGARDSFRPN
jgi:hypothetical protein